MQNVVPLIHTKLHPPFTGSELVPRPRLQAQIREGLLRPLTLIAAPAGFGKTTLVASYIATCGMPTAWLSLDKDDNQVRRFLNYLIAALQSAAPTLGHEAAQSAAAAQAPPEVVLTMLINDVDRTNTEVALVLDDYQFINNPVVHGSVTFLLDHCPATLHLVITTRSDPPLPLARLRARRQMLELRAADLRFTESEAAQFLNGVLGLELDANAIKVLEERTEGWIAGLQMASLAVQARLSVRGRDNVDRLIRSFAGTQRFIMDYLLEEVLARETKDVQAFLLQTAILTRLNGPLCDAVTGTSGGQEMLEALERRNLFVVPLDEERRWYRYHHLFADLLRARMNQLDADRAAQLRSRAAAWCEEAGQIADAVDYALGAQDYRRAGGLIAEYWYVAANTGEIETAWAWLNALPEDEIKHSAPLGIAYCWALWLRGQAGAIAPRLADVENALDEGSVVEDTGTDDAAHADLRVQLALLQSMVARYDNDFEAAVAFAERALSLLPQDLSPQDEGQLRALISFALASAYDGAGDLEQAIGAYAEHIRLSRMAANVTGLGIVIRMSGALRILGRLQNAQAACRDALAYVQAHGMSRLPASGILYVAMGEVLVERNDLEAAEAHLTQGLEIGKWGGRLDAARNAAYALSRLRQARHDANGALAAIREAESAIGDPQPSLARAELLALRARILVGLGDLSGAARCIEEAKSLAGRDRGQSAEWIALAAARLLSAQHDPNEATAQLARSIAAAEERGWLGAALELYILRSLALARRGDTREAGVNLERALVIAEPEGYARVFLDEGEPMQRLLAQWLARAADGPLRDYAGRLLSQFDTELQVLATSQEEVTREKQALIEPLSERELEILHHIALGKTNKAIAQQLFIAPGTVKAHTASIYRKLDVANRTEAVARARQLSLLS